MPKPTIVYAVIGFDLSRERPLIFKAAFTIPTLHNVLDEALRRGARIIAIRAIHPLPEPKGD